MFTDFLNNPAFMELAKQVKEDVNHPLHKLLFEEVNKSHVKVGGTLTSIYMGLPNLLEGLAIAPKDTLTQEEWDEALVKAEEIKTKFKEFAEFLQSKIVSKVEQYSK